MYERCWNLSGGKHHAFPVVVGMPMEAMCSNTIKPTGIKYLSLEEIAASGATPCEACYTALRRLIAENKGEIMSEDDALARIDVNSREFSVAAETVTANCERITTLRRAGQKDEADELAAETETLISSYSGKGSIATKKDARAHLSDAMATPLPLSGIVMSSGADDPRQIPGMSELIDSAAKRFREGAKLGVQLGSIGKDIAETMINARLKMLRPDGLPDLEARGNRTKRLSTIIYSEAQKDTDESDQALADAYESIKRASQNAIKDTLVGFLRRLDSNSADEIRGWFPTLELTEGTSHTEAVYAAYEAAGTPLPRKSRTEELAEKRAAARAALEAQASGGDSTATIVNAFDRGGERVSKAKSFAELAVADAKKLDGEARAKLREELQALGTKLIAEAAQL